MPTTTERKATLETRLTKIQTAIDGTLDRGVLSYSIEGRSLASMSISELQKLETQTLNEIAKLDRLIANGTRFGGIGFKAVTS